jgi:cell wall-associated NlpC family hydrolase
MIIEGRSKKVASYALATKRIRTTSPFLLTLLFSLNLNLSFASVTDGVLIGKNFCTFLTASNAKPLSEIADEAKMSAIESTEETNREPKKLRSVALPKAEETVAVAEVVTKKVEEAPKLVLSDRRQHFVWFAESYTGWSIPYRLGKASIDEGFDCSGFVHYALDYFDVKTARTAAAQSKIGTEIPVENARPGDLVFFGKESISHVAVVISNDEEGLVVVHSTSSVGIKRDNITKSDYWKPKLRSIAINILGQ